LRCQNQVFQTKQGKETYRGVVADLFSTENSVSSMFIASPFGKVLLAKNGVVGLLLHAGRGGSGRVRPVEGRDEPARSIQEAILRSLACRDGSKELGMVAPVLTINKAKAENSGVRSGMCVCVRARVCV